MNSARGLQPWLMGPCEWLVRAAAYNGLNPEITSTYRTRQQQQELYNAYLQGKSRFPALPPGYSMHEKGRAFDLHINDERQLAALGALWRAMGGRWSATDPIHFEA